MKLPLVVVIATALCATSLAAERRAKPSPSDDNPGQIRISCYRGPLREVIWDRPNAVFIDDLVQIGYSLSEASWLAERVCRDEYGVYDEAYIVDRFRILMKQNPPGK